MNIIGLDKVSGDLFELARTDPRHYTQSGKTGAAGDAGKTSFEQAMLEAMDGVNAKQLDADSLVQSMMTDPDSVDAHELTIGMAEANMSLNIARTLIDRVTKAWKEVINVR